MFFLFEAGKMIKWEFDEKLEKKIVDWVNKNFNYKLEGRIVFAKGNKIECFLISKEIEKVLKEMETNPYTVGLYLGKWRNKFRPSIQLLHEVVKTAKNVIEIGEEEEKEFTYGKDLVNVYGKTGLFILKNKNGAIGLAELDKDIIKNLKDVGEYLRRGY